MSYDDWRYDEFQQVGRDYGQSEEAEIYDQRHADFRDLEGEANALLDELDLKPRDVLIDLGAGTGVLAVQAAKRCARVHAVDVSQAMLDQAQAKAKAAGADNIEFHHGGFLTYEHPGPLADFVTSSLALHHLPDFWKAVALDRVRAMLKPGGVFYLRDVVVRQEPSMAETLGHAAEFIEHLAEAGGDYLRQDIERHFKEEYSTFHWVMAGLLVRTGFKIKDKTMEHGVLATYVCVRS